MGLDLSQDYLLIDDPITVQFLSRTSETEWAEGAYVNYAQRNDVTKEDIEADGSLLGKDATVFHVWKANLGALVPKVGDKVTYLGATWQVKTVGVRDRDADGPQRYRLVCLRAKVPA